MSADHDLDRSVWWVGEEALMWREAFVQWLSGIDSPRLPQSTWRIHIIGRDALSLPRLTTRWTEQKGGGTPCVVWAIPAAGIADLIQPIDHIRQARPGYSHITAGLASPVERMLLSEFGIAMHVQHPCDWRRCHTLLTGR